MVVAFCLCSVCQCLPVSAVCVREKQVKYSISRRDVSVHDRDKVFVCI